MKVAIMGAGGRMGQMLVRQVARTSGASLAAAIDAPGSNALGRDVGEMAGIDRAGVAITSDAAAGLAKAGACWPIPAPRR